MDDNSATHFQGAHAKRADDGDRTVADAPPGSTPPGLPPELRDHPRYRVLTLLGAGGMGAVYKAEHLLMKRVVALKVMNRALVGSAGTVDRFRREFRASALLSHPNIVAAYDAEQAGDVHFLVMEYVEGTDLARRLADRGPLPAAEACDYVRQAARGLQHAHERGMIHRDVKPHNLMLTPDGTIKVLDFGLARLAAESATLVGGMTGQGALLGTVDYLAPEQADDARRADIRSDVYSLGCTLYHLLAGRPPFPQGTVVQKIMAHTNRQPTPLRELRADLPPGLPEVVGRMMAKSPEDRQQTPDEVDASLAPFTSQTVIVDPAPVPKKRAAGPRRRRRLVAAAAGLVALVGIVAGAAVYRLKTDGRERVVGGATGVAAVGRPTEPRPDGALVFKDDFDQPQPLAVPLFPDHLMSFGQVRGEGVLTPHAEGILPLLYPKTKVADFYAELDVRVPHLDAESGYGLLFRSADVVRNRLDDYYALWLCPGRTIDLACWHEGRGLTRRSLELNQGDRPVRETNRIRLEAVGA
ncbi:MAG TPA: serine/threonine-protein kinase, partial [Gemmataceae bacterium]|nr:serine/threonine-protein kinase [Gemmataceae bacterium]